MRIPRTACQSVCLHVFLFVSFLIIIIDSHFVHMYVIAGEEEILSIPGGTVDFDDGSRSSHEGKWVYIIVS